ncbi:MAG TPA: LytTR family DNA-binding domain-containing protein [Bacteroidales bacterium]|nr:LytTR family DNA-binding domain-containing protein [Bacteroidales bacterium]
MDSGFDHLVKRFKSEFGLIFKVSSGLFLFMLFFEPFPVSKLNFNNHILFYAGIGLIIFFSAIFSTIIVQFLGRVFPENIETKPEITSFIRDFLIFLFSSAGSLFYLVYAGQLELNILILFRVFLICISPGIILEIHDKIVNLKVDVRTMTSDKRQAEIEIERYKNHFPAKEVEFKSENANENFILDTDDVIFIRSADNYVEIAYMESDLLKRKLIRNTLKNIELQLMAYPNFIRCHRICIVNTRHVENLKLINNNYVLSVRGFGEKLPVSRQYLIRLREALE